jgi:hypothetical protein
MFSDSFRGFQDLQAASDDSQSTTLTSSTTGVHMSTISSPTIDGNHHLPNVVHGWAGQLRASLAKARRIGPASVCLARHETRYLTGFRGSSIACLEGCLWLTHDGDCRDIVLEAGQSHVADRDSRLAIHALAPSTVRLDHAA